MDNQRVDRAGGSVSDSYLRFRLSSAFVIVVFALIHFVAGCAFIFTWIKLGSWRIIAIPGRILVNIWWFPAQQLYQLHHSDDLVSRFAFPIADSLLWGAVVFVIWKARQGQYFRFSVRSLLIATTLVAVLLGAIVWLTKYFNPTT